MYISPTEINGGNQIAAKWVSRDFSVMKLVKINSITYVGIESGMKIIIHFQTQMGCKDLYLWRALSVFRLCPVLSSGRWKRADLLVILLNREYWLMQDITYDEFKCQCH